MEEDKNQTAGLDASTPHEPEAKDLMEVDEMSDNQPIQSVLEPENSSSVETPKTELKTETIIETTAKEAEAINGVDSNLETQPAPEAQSAVEKNSDEAISDDQLKADSVVEDIKADSIDPVKDNKSMFNKKNIIRVAVVLALILAVIYIITQKSEPKETDYSDLGISVNGELEQGKISIIEETKEDIQVLTNNDKEIKLPVTEVFSFFGNSQKNPNSQDCEQVFGLKREIAKRYDSNMLNSVLGLLEPLTAKEKEAGYLSVIPTGTFLQYIKLDDSGVATANFSGNISKAAGSCAVMAIRAQIEKTLMQFASVKSVVICINDNCHQDEILQP